MPVDTSMYQSQSNPLDQLTGIVNLAGGAQRNQMLQQENQLLQAKVGVGEKVRQNVDQNGQLDPAGLLYSVASDPVTAPAFADVKANIYDPAMAPTMYTGPSGKTKTVPLITRQQQISGIPANVNTLPQDQIDQMHDKLDAMHGAATSVINNPTRDNAVDSVLALYPKHVDAATAAGTIGSLPTDPDAIKAQAAQHVASIAAAKAQVTQAYGPRGGQAIQQPSPESEGPSLNVQQSQKNYEDVQAAATAAPDVSSALSESANIAAKGEGLTGTDLSELKQKLAKTGLAPESLVQFGSNAQTAQKWIAQALIKQGMPNSDYRLQNLEAGNLNPHQLQETITELAPYFKAQQHAATLKQNYYDKSINYGNNPENEPAAKAAWDSSYDPRWVEYNDLPNDQAKQQFLQNHPDLLQKKSQYKAFKSLIK